MFGKIWEKFKKEDVSTENKYEIYGKKLEELGYFRPIYKSESITICFVSDYTYYMVTNNAGVAISIKSEKFLDIINDPSKTVIAYLDLPKEYQHKISFYIHIPGVEEYLKRIKEFILENPEKSGFNPEMEQKVYDLYGYPEKFSLK